MQLALIHFAYHIVNVSNSVGRNEPVDFFALAERQHLFGMIGKGCAVGKIVNDDVGEESDILEFTWPVGAAKRDVKGRRQKNIKQKKKSVSYSDSPLA